MANIGDILTSPEEGWKRIDDNNSLIVYDTGWSSGINTNCYNKTYHQCQSSSLGKFTIYIKSKKVRIIGITYPTYSDKIKCTINDNEVEYFSSQYSNSQYQTILYEKTLSKKYNKLSFEMINATSLGYVLDAIDIDEDGELVTEEEYIHKPPKYLIYDDNKFKTIIENRITEITDYKSEFLADNNVCITDLNQIVTFIPNLSNQFIIYKNQA